ncbi:putative glyoxalase/Bleomycin resistance protein/Dihydroxybiphenyl dioxygenase [Helianthus annuus]|nr:putative glyoxalase/Bleomycin resistance protein/Dihydroxybiphenyl dioxygenase [Helianthus annuus]KAJ0820563.1 putative glyoxalase/Bleomycin resistance protein/Dihydroxybiphenyl dioxygenase [Helianthus annuus]KAJ0835160.1 putative glyoxalase/Bleomycin resistance protein/Dihydroxybiphenyl dioxygenase [Helianthus annuus]
MATEVNDGAVAAGEVNGAAVEKTVTFTAVKPRLFVEALKVGDAVAFYKAAFGAEEVNRVNHPKRKADQELPVLISAEIKLANSSFLVSDVSEDSTATDKAVGSGLVFCLETEDIEAAVDAAVKAGAVADGEISEGEGACCGGRVGKVKDPYGVAWAICTPTAKKCGDVEA